MPFKDKILHQEELRLYRRIHYNKNKEYYKGKTKDRKRMLRDWIIGIKTNKICKTCTESRSPCLTFHHRNPKNKEYEIGDMVSNGYSKERILKEIEKCDIICFNCHMYLHWK